MMHQSDMSTMNNINYYNYNKYNNVINNKTFHTFRISEYSETLFKVDTKYVPVKGVGEGAYGVVCSCINTKTNEKVAIKKIMNVFDDGVAAVRALRELKILRYVRHDNVIALKDVMITSSKSTFKDIYLVYELMDTDLDRIIRSNQLLSHDHIKYFMFQLLRGLNHLHSANILHRDLKPKNLLINANCDLKICDFGLARTNNGGRGQSMTEYVVTRWYRAPELLLNCDNYGPSIDVWSVGCIFAELLGRKPIFPGKDPLDQIKWIIYIVGTPDHSNLAFVKKCRELKFLKSLPYSSGQMMLSLFPKADPFALNLLWKMLEFDPRKRITVSEALKHPYFSDLYVPNLLGTAPFPCDLDMDANIGVDKIRNLIWNEMSLYHPEPPVHLSSRLRYSWDDDAHYF